jgi:hypothetical protein
MAASKWLYWNLAGPQNLALPVSQKDAILTAMQVSAAGTVTAILANRSDTIANLLAGFNPAVMALLKLPTAGGIDRVTINLDWMGGESLFVITSATVDLVIYYQDSPS